MWNACNTDGLGGTDIALSAYAGQPGSVRFWQRPFWVLDDKG